MILDSEMFVFRRCSGREALLVSRKQPLSARLCACQRLTGSSS